VIQEAETKALMDKLLDHLFTSWLKEHARRCPNCDEGIEEAVCICSESVLKMKEIQGKIKEVLNGSGRGT